MAPFTLYTDKMSSGSANFLIACLSGADFDTELVDLQTKLTPSGKDLHTVNPKGNLPTIGFSESGAMLNENVATITFLSEQGPSGKLIPAAGTPARYAFFNTLGFLNSEVHPAFGALFGAPPPGDARRTAALDKATGKAVLFEAAVLAGKDFALGGDAPSAVDVYASVIFSWGVIMGLELPAGIAAFCKRVGDDAGVVAARAKLDAL